jgi:hypothetical protein
LLALLWLLGVPTAAAAQKVHIDLATPVSGPNLPIGWEFSAELLAGGERIARPLKKGAEGHFQAVFEVDGLQRVGLLLRAESIDGGRPLLIHQGMEILSLGETTLHFALAPPSPGTPPPGTAHRLSRAAEVPEIARWTEGVAALGVLWGIGVLVGVLGLVLRSRGRLQTALDDAGWGFHRVWEPLIWLGLSLAWTWPAALAGPGRLVGRHFDTQGTIWTIDAAPRLISGLADAATCWPLGAEYSNIDSFVLLPVAAALHWVGAVRLHAWLGILGVAATAWAASGMAQAMGARRPWSLIAGGIFAFSGLAASALLEGHVYHVMGPWLPLMVWALWRATDAEGRMLHGLLGGLCFALALLTTGYLGVAAALLSIGLLIGGIWTRRGAAALPTLGFVLIALPVGLAYLSMFAGGTDLVTGYSSPETLRIGSISMASIGLPTAEVDRVGHSWAMVLSPLGLVLALLAPRLLGADPRRLLLLLSGLLSLLLAMGPDLAVGSGSTDPLLPSPLGWVWDLPGGNYLRFPGRIAWAWNLVAGGLGALSAQAIASRVGRRARWLLLALLVEAFVLVGLPWRQVSRPAGAPELLRTASGPIFALLPEGTNPNGEADSWMSALSCLHQVDHGKPIADDCVTVPATGSPRVFLGRWVAARIIEGRGPAAWERLSELGFTNLAWFPDLVHPSTAQRIETALSELDEIPGQGGPGGGQVRLFQLPSAALTRTDLPDPEPATSIAIGQPVVEDWRPRISLYLPPELLGMGRYFVRIVSDGGEEKQLELKEAGGPGDWKNDALLSTSGTVQVPGGAVLTLWSVHDGQETELWSGDVQPVAGPEDPLVFAVDPTGERAWPILAVMDSLGPEVRHKGGWIQLAGWTLFGLIFVLALKPRRR